LAALHTFGRGAAEKSRAFPLKEWLLALASIRLYALNQAIRPRQWNRLEDGDARHPLILWKEGRARYESEPCDNMKKRRGKLYASPKHVTEEGSDG
jgi:hypothetical protein